MDEYAGERRNRLADNGRHEAGARETMSRVRPFAILWRAALVIAMLAGTGFLAQQWISDRPERPQRQARERSFPVAIVSPELGTFAPTIRANGQILASQTMDVRAQVGGVVQTVSPGLVEGGRLSQGEIALGVDEFTYRNNVSQARFALADATSTLESARRQLELNRSSLDIARSQVSYAERDLERAKSLAKVGTVSDKALADLELALEQKRQAVTQQEGAVALQEAAISRQQTALARARIGLQEAQKALEYTRIVSPYDARVISTNVQPGKVVAPNEVVARLYKADALEVKFALPDARFGPLAAGGLLDRPVAVIWQAGDAAIHTTGRIVRTGADVQTGIGSVAVFATLDGANLELLRPGTFVDVTLKGVAHENAYRLPETALYEQSHIFVRTEKGRMQPVPVSLYAYDGDHVIVGTEAPLTAPVIVTHLAQAGEGVRVVLEGEDPRAQSSQAPKSAPGADRPSGQTFRSQQEGDRPQTNEAAPTTDPENQRPPANAPPTPASSASTARGEGE